MKASPDTIWHAQVYLPYLQPDLSDHAISEAEQEIGFRLPESLLAVLRQQNGGHIRYTLDGFPHEMIYGIGPNYPSLTRYNLAECFEGYTGFELDGLVPFDGDGHWYLCLDYRRCPETPSVIFIDMEDVIEREIAKTFSEYLDVLHVNVSEGDFVLPEALDVDGLLAELGAGMGIHFEPPDFERHGYPVYRARVVGKEPGWIWISPNLVSRGFVRSDDPRYEELRDRLPGKGLRYPGLPDSSLIVSVTKGLQGEVMSACRARSIDIRLLSECVS